MRRLLTDCPLPLVLSVSATTRKPRPGETHGVEYFFLSHSEFASKREQGEFLECKEVFGRGDWYGTPREQVTTGLSEGKWIILEIDVEGAQAVIDQHPEAITIFLHPGSLDELERRLRGRGTDSEDAVRRRLEVARRELECVSRYRHQVVNDLPDEAVQRICSILAGAAAQGSAN